METTNLTVLFQSILRIWLLLAGLSFVTLFFVPAPYGRYALRKGPQLPDRLGWVLMESPAALVFLWEYLRGPYRTSLPALVLALLWLGHYAERSWVYPFTRRKSSHAVPLVLAATSFSFNAVNGWLNGVWLFTLSGGYPESWLRDPRFWLGCGLFLAGYAINRHADRILYRLRNNGQGYQIPHGGLYRWVSNPHYLGEIVQWLGWAIATWSPAGAAFALWTFANLAPRAHAHHRWYREHFPDYPAKRRALIPWLW